MLRIYPEISLRYEAVGIGVAKGGFESGFDVFCGGEEALEGVEFGNGGGVGREDYSRCGIVGDEVGVGGGGEAAGLFVSCGSDEGEVLTNSEGEEIVSSDARDALGNVLRASG